MDLGFTDSSDSGSIDADKEASTPKSGLNKDYVPAGLVEDLIRRLPWSQSKPERVIVNGKTYEIENKGRNIKAYTLTDKQTGEVLNVSEKSLFSKLRKSSNIVVPLSKKSVFTLTPTDEDVSTKAQAKEERENLLEAKETLEFEKDKLERSLRKNSIPTTGAAKTLDATIQTLQDLKSKIDNMLKPLPGGNSATKKVRVTAIKGKASARVLQGTVKRIQQVIEQLHKGNC